MVSVKFKDNRQSFDICNIVCLSLLIVSSVLCVYTFTFLMYVVNFT